MERQLATVRSYDEFVDFVFRWLWQLTNISLEKVRTYLATTAIQRMNADIATLQRELMAMEDVDISELLDALNKSRPETVSAFERLSSWFTLSSNVEYLDYSLQIAYEAGLATVKSYYSNLDIASTFVTSEPVMMFGWTLPYFVRLYSLLLENAAYHSEITDGRLALRAEARIEQSVLIVSVLNNLSPSKNLERVRTKIKTINEEFGRERASSRVREEGDRVMRKSGKS